MQRGIGRPVYSVVGRCSPLTANRQGKAKHHRPVGSFSEKNMGERHLNEKGPGPVWIELSVIAVLLTAIAAYTFWVTF